MYEGDVRIYNFNVDPIEMPSFVYIKERYISYGIIMGCCSNELQILALNFMEICVYEIHVVHDWATTTTLRSFITSCQNGLSSQWLMKHFASYKN